MPHETETSMGTLVKDAVDNIRESLNPEPYLGWIAASAVAVGGVMAARGLRRSKQRPTMPDEVWDYVDCVLP